MNREESEKKLSAALEHVSPAHLRSRALVTKRLTFRMHEEEFEEIRRTAESLDLSISDYFCALHHYAAARIEGIDRGADWVHRNPRHREDSTED